MNCVSIALAGDVIDLLVVSFTDDVDEERTGGRKGGGSNTVHAP